MPSWLVGLLIYALANALLVLVVGALLHADRTLGLLRRLLRRLRALVPPPMPRPSGMPIERIAADVRRLRQDIGALPPQMPQQRRRGVLAAYDDALLAACQALELSTTLAALPEGIAHDLERLRVEEELRRSGLVLAS